ncbi:MAG: ABC transporter ATP-binding protein [Oxalobacteraceae bacterium]
MLSTRQLSIAAGDRKLVDALDWQVCKGEFWCVLGRNGSGKTTLLHTLAGVLNPVAGEVRLQDALLSEIEPAALARLRGLMPQAVSDAFQDSVFNAVAIARVPHRMGAAWDTAEDIAAVWEALARVGLCERMADDITQLSGGERQRVALAALIVQSPDLMLLDEPVAHQDIGHQLEVMRRLRELSETHAVIASCHDINLAARFATHVLLLGDRVHWQGRVEQVMEEATLSRAFACRFSRDGLSWVAH